MRYLALAADYDGTLAMSGVAERRGRRRIGTASIVRTSGGAGHRQNVRGIRSGLLQHGVVRLRRTGERSRSLLTVDAAADRAVPTGLTAARTRADASRVEPVIRGQAIVATRRPNEIAVLETIRDLGLELQIIFNGAGGHGAALRREQGQRSAGGPARDWALHTRDRRRGQCGERSFVPRDLRMLGGGGQRRRCAQSEGRLLHARLQWQRRGGAD